MQLLLLCAAFPVACPVFAAAFAAAAATFAAAFPVVCRPLNPPLPLSSAAFLAFCIVFATFCCCLMLAFLVV